jgi:hypothetical protein
MHRLISISFQLVAPTYAEDGTRGQSHPRGEIGSGICNEHQIPDEDVAVPTHAHDGAPPLYFDLAIEQGLGRRFFAGLTGGLSFDVGPFVYPNLRYGVIERETGTLTVGAGPMFQDVESGWSTFAAADITGQLALGSTLIVSAGADHATAVQRRGAPTCGVDTCDAYVSRGDHILVFRAGLGFRI